MPKTSTDYAAGFEMFWDEYPHRAGKLAAQRAYEKARRGGATAEAIVLGVRRYARMKPVWQSWAHPATWLNAGRWMDEPSEPRTLATAQYEWNCPHDPPCLGRHACSVKSLLDEGRSA